MMHLQLLVYPSLQVGSDHPLLWNTHAPADDCGQLGVVVMADTLVAAAPAIEGGVACRLLHF